MGTPEPFSASFEDFAYQTTLEGFEMRELKDQLCTLLITFQDDQDPTKEITAAHTFASIRPQDYPQHRRVVHSRHTERDALGQLLGTTERLSQSSLATIEGRPLGSDMVEHRRVLSSPPFVTAAAGAAAATTLSPNSLQAEKPGSALSGQMRHTNTSGTPSPLPSAGSSMISVHEVSLMYMRTLEPVERRLLPPQIAARGVTSFPASGSVHVHLGGPDKAAEAATKLPYTVSRPQGEWTFQRAGEQVQISDQPAPKTRGAPLPDGGRADSNIPVRMHQQQQIGGEAADGGPTTQRQQQAGPTDPRSPPMPQRSPSGHPVQSHRQSRSFESSEQSSMLEQRGRGKAKTVFQKTTCELVTEKSVTTFSPTAAPKPPVQPPPARGLPRYRHAADRDMQAHLYTRYDDGKMAPQKVRVEQPPSAGRELIVHEEHSRVEEEFRSVKSVPKPIVTKPQPQIVSPQPPPKPMIVEPRGQEVQKPRLIDFETYKREVEQLQRQAAAISGPGDGRQLERPVPLSPAIVLPQKSAALPKAPAEPSTETTIKYFAREEFWQRKRDPKGSAEESPSDEELRRLEEERQRREEERRRLEQVQKIKEERRRLVDAERAAKREEELRRQIAEQERLMREEEEKRRKAAAAEMTKPGQQLVVATTAEVYQSVETVSRIPVAAKPSKMAKLEEQVQMLPALPVTASKTVDVQIAQEERTEQLLLPKWEERPKEVEEIEEKPEEMPQKLEEPPVDYELDTSDMGKRLFEQLRRELQYEEEINTEVQRRRRQRGGVDVEELSDEEAEVAATERVADTSEIGRMTSTEEEVESEEVEPPSEEAALWREHPPFEPPPPAGIVSPRHAVKVSMSGELPPLLEEEEAEPSFEERVELVETSTVQTRTKPTPPLPPPKPPHSTHFGTFPSERRRESSYSSAYSYLPSPAYTQSSGNSQIPPHVRMEYSPASSEYRSAISARQHYPRPMRSLSPIQGVHGGHRVLKMVSETSSISSRPISPYPGSTAASAIRDAREREKKEMSDLNDRLANYIEKVRFLEAQNRKLATDLDFLRNRWGRDAANVRDMYEADLLQARKLIDETGQQRDDLEKKARAMAEEMAQLRRKNDDALRAHDQDKERMEELLLKLAALESELSALKRRLAILEEDVKALKRENVRLTSELQRARTDLDQETLNRIDYQNQAQTLLEEIDFLRRAHDQEIQDLQAMAARDTTQENREFFRSELASAMRDIRDDYERLNNRNRTDIESWYKLKVQEIQTQSARQSMEQNYAKEEVKRLRTQLGDLRGKLADLEGKNSLLEKQAEELAYQLDDDQRSNEAALNDRDGQIRKMRDECQALMVELQMLLDTKQTLDAEIAIYRRMLEGEEDRAGLRQLVEQVVRTHQQRHSDETESTRVLRGEKSSRQSYQRSAKGNVSILEASPDGKYIVLENTHRSKEEPIGEWKLKRRVDGRRDIVFTFPRDFLLRPGKTVWARNQGGFHSPPEQLVFEGEESFGVGTNVQTILYNREGEERASLIQRSSGAPATRQ